MANSDKSSIGNIFIDYSNRELPLKPMLISTVASTMAMETLSQVTS